MWILGIIALAAWALSDRDSAPARATDAAATAATTLTGSTLERLVKEITALVRAGKSNDEIRALMNGRGIGGQDLDLAIEAGRFEAARDDGTVT